MRVVIIIIIIVTITSKGQNTATDSRAPYTIVHTVHAAALG